MLLQYQPFEDPLEVDPSTVELNVTLLMGGPTPPAPTNHWRCIPRSFTWPTQWLSSMQLLLKKCSSDVSWRCLPSQKYCILKWVLKTVVRKVKTRENSLRGTAVITRRLQHFELRSSKLESWSYLQQASGALIKLHEPYNPRLSLPTLSYNQSENPLIASIGR